MERTAELAKGRWREILLALEVSKKLLNKLQQPCPFCGGKDRFQWKDYGGTGGYICRQCGNGDGFELLKKLKGWDYRKAAAAIDDVLGVNREKIKPVSGVSYKHAECCATPEEERAHRAAQGFFSKNPDFSLKSTMQILLDESIPFDEAMEIISDRQFRGVGKREPSKSLRDATLWLRKYHPHKLPDWLARHEPELAEWLGQERP